MALAGLENTTGTKIYVAAGEPTAYTVTAIKAMTRVEVQAVVSFGEWGDREADVNEVTLTEDRVIHTNGAKDGGEVTVVIQHRATDAGAALIKANAGNNAIFTLIKEYKSGDVEVASGVFSSPRYRPAQGDAVRGWTAMLRVNTKVFPFTNAEWDA